MCQFALWAQPLLAHWTPDNIFNSIFVLIWIVYGWNTYLSYRQYKVYLANEKVPASLEGHLTQETMEKARLYNLDKARYAFLYGFFSQVMSSLLLLVYALPIVWNFTKQLLGEYQKNELLVTVIFTLITSIFSQIISLPWSLYFTFVIEERHGFNKYSLRFYLVDKLKKFVVMNAITLPVAVLAIYIISVGGKYFFIYVWGFLSMVVLIMATVYPDYIAPLFDQFKPLPESQIKSKIEELASSVKYPLKQIFIVENSKRSSHSNAYLYGMFNRKKIVLFDTLISSNVLDVKSIFAKPDEKENEKPAENENSEERERKEKEEHEKNELERCDEDEILAVLGHELGHWKLNHVMKNMIIAELNMFITFAVFGALYQNDQIYQAFGFYNEKPILIGLFIVFEYIFLPYNEIFSFFLTCLSRRFEFQADAFAKELKRAEPLKRALVKLNRSNLSFPLNDWLFSAWNHSHPPLLERLEPLEKVE